MTSNWVKEQIKFVEQATKEATKSKEAAQKFLKNAGISVKDKSVKTGKKG